MNHLQLNAVRAVSPLLDPRSAPDPLLEHGVDPDEPLYDRIGATYSTTRSADPTIAATLAALMGLQPSGEYLDLACGAGTYTAALHQHGGAWWGLDRSDVMLAQARPRSDRICWDVGTAEQQPYADHRFDAVACVNAIHFFDMGASLRETHRVLKPAGQVAIFTSLTEQLERYWLNEYFPGMMAEAALAMPTSGRIVGALSAAGFLDIRRVDFRISGPITDLFLYAGKHSPRIYLNPVVTSNMSQFKRFCSAEELCTGVARLTDDLATGRFDAVAQRYTRTSQSDCTFFMASKQAA